MRHESLWQENTAEQSGPIVRMLTQPAVNQALVHNSVPLAGRLRVTNASGQPAVDTTVTVRLFGNGEEPRRPGPGRTTATATAPTPTGAT